jgi:hypothetical protein
MKKTSEFWTWYPCISVGPFYFGDNINKYIKRYDIRNKDTCKNSVWIGTKYPRLKDIGAFKNTDEFFIPKFGSAFTIYTNNNLIDDIRIETYLYYNKKDIIYVTIDEAMKIINRSTWDELSSAEVIDDIQQVYRFYDMGLSLWVLDGKVVTAFCDNGTRWKNDDVD